jgi:hypothetical protein
LRGKCLGFHHFAGWPWDIVELAVGKDAVDVHQQKFDLGGTGQSALWKLHDSFVPLTAFRTIGLYSTPKRMRIAKARQKHGESSPENGPI